MKKIAEIHVIRNGENIKITNNMGGEWGFKSTRPQPLIASLIALSVEGWFNIEETNADDFKMTLHVESLSNK